MRLIHNFCQELEERAVVAMAAQRAFDEPLGTSGFFLEPAFQPGHVFLADALADWLRFHLWIYPFLFVGAGN